MIIDPETTDGFGTSVAVGSSFLGYPYAIVGAPEHSGGGRAYVFGRGGGPGLVLSPWYPNLPIAEGQGAGANDHFGQSVALDPRGGYTIAGGPEGGYLVAGSSGTGNNAGSVWLFAAVADQDRPGSLAAVLPGQEVTNNNPSPGSQFGYSIALIASAYPSYAPSPLVLAGAPYWNNGSFSVGSAYEMIGVNGTTVSPSTWWQGQMGHQPIYEENVGTSIATDGSAALVGAPFSNSVFVNALVPQSVINPPPATPDGGTSAPAMADEAPLLGALLLLGGFAALNRKRRRRFTV
ncbi:MAG: hypothetical protein ABTD50_15750 [Polyangiaceae bacterium]